MSDRSATIVFVYHARPLKSDAYQWQKPLSLRQHHLQHEMLCESSCTYECQNNRKQESYIHRDDRFVVFIPFAKIMKNEK